MDGIKGHNSKEQTITSIVNYGGIATLGVIAINPDGEQLKKILGISEIKEPIYTGIVLKGNDGTENTYNKIVFYLQGECNVKTDKKDLTGKAIIAKEKITARREILVANEPDISSKGTHRTINGLGTSTWQSVDTVIANEKMNWFSKDTPLHEALKGEADLLEVVREWMNLAAKDACNFKAPAAICSGDVTELQGLLKAQPNNAITVLLGVNINGDKAYQAVYNKCTSRPTAKNIADKFRKALNEAYGEFKALYPNDLELTYVSTVVVDTPDDAEKLPATSSWV